MKIIHLASLLAAVALAGCSSTKLDTDVPVESRTPTTVGSLGGGAGSGATTQSQVTPVDLTNRNNNAAGNVVYFDFDSFALKDEYRPIVDNYARTLTGDRKRRVVVAGHTDERGGREYNLALGQKRAESVTKALALLGATDTQLEAVSYGKERPAASGSDETAYARNRRAELNYR